MKMGMRVYWLILALVLVSPLFGVVGAGIVGYHEPLDLVAGMIGLGGGNQVWRGLLPDYTFPGVPDVVGYALSGLIGVAVLLIPSILRGRRK